MATDAPEAIGDEASDSHFQSVITTRVKIHDDKDMWVVPLSTVVGLCFVVYSKDYNGNLKDDRTGYVARPMSQWAGEFL